MRVTSCVSLTLLLAPTVAPAQIPEKIQEQVLSGIEGRRAQYSDVARRIWGFAEVGYQVAEIPTAFVASYGSGKLVIAFVVGEFDRLPGLSQDAVPQGSNR